MKNKESNKLFFDDIKVKLFGRPPIETTILSQMFYRCVNEDKKALEGENMKIKSLQWEENNNEWYTDIPEIPGYAFLIRFNKVSNKFNLYRLYESYQIYTEEGEYETSEIAKEHALADARDVDNFGGWSFFQQMPNNTSERKFYKCILENKKFLSRKILRKGKNEN